MARRRNYGFERRRREELNRQRQDAKRERKAARTEQGETGPEMGAPQESGAPAGQWEWFSPSRGRVVTTAVGQHPPADDRNDWVLLTEGAEEEHDEDAGGTEDGPDDDHGPAANSRNDRAP